MSERHTPQKCRAARLQGNPARCGSSHLAGFERIAGRDGNGGATADDDKCLKQHRVKKAKAPGWFVLKSGPRSRLDAARLQGRRFEPPARLQGEPARPRRCRR